MSKPKKPFNRTKIGQILTSKPFRTAIGFIPGGVGSGLETLLEPTMDSKSGAMTKEQLVKWIIKMGIYTLIGLAVLKGWVSWEDADSLKDFTTE